MTKMPGWTHPIRIPATVPVSHADPAVAVAGRCGTWRLPFLLGKAVPPGAALKLQVFGGRNNKGEFAGLQADSPAGAGYLGVTADGTALRATPAASAGLFNISVPGSGLAEGTEVTVTLGDPAGGGDGVRAPGGRLLDKFFVLYAMTAEDRERAVPSWTGGGSWSIDNWDWMVAACTMHILGGELDHLRAYAPSQVSPREAFAVLVRPEDGNSNLSPAEVSRLAVFLGDTPLQTRIEPVPGSTCVRAVVSIEAEGVHRLRVRDLASGKEDVTNPLICRSAAGRGIYWGMIHGHTEMSDGTMSLEHYFRQLRDEAGLDFAAPGDHDHLWETSDAFWGVTCEAVKRWNEPGRFVTFPGYEWAKWRKNGDGDRNVYYPVDDRPMHRSDDGEYPSPPDLFRVLRETGEQAIVIPHHPGHRGNFCDWKDHGAEFERLVEIFQLRGSYECSAEDGNPVPETDAVDGPYEDGFVRRALELGWRVGFTAGGDDHAGLWGTEAPFSRHGYKQGLMCVQADAVTREAIWDGLYSRRVVATTGKRILLSYELDGEPMGSELAATDRPALAERRCIRGAAHGTAPIDRVDIVRSGRVVQTFPGEGRLDMEFEWEDTEPLAGICLPPAKYCDHPFAYYYVRVVQTDNEVAWASPVWVDP